MSLFTLYMFISHAQYIKLFKKENTYPQGCSPVKLLQTCGTFFYKNIYGGLLPTCLNLHFKSNVFKRFKRALIKHFQPNM